MLSKLRFKIKKVSHPINKDSSSLDNNSKTEELYPITIFKKNQPYI